MTGRGGEKVAASGLNLGVYVPDAPRAREAEEWRQRRHVLNDRFPSMSSTSQRPVRTSGRGRNSQASPAASRQIKRIASAGKPGPSIERACPGKPGQASHLKRQAGKREARAIWRNGKFGSEARSRQRSSKSCPMRSLNDSYRRLIGTTIPVKTTALMATSICTMVRPGASSREVCWMSDLDTSGRSAVLRTAGRDLLRGDREEIFVSTSHTLDSASVLL
ncbi:MAG: hypothetical protein JWO70_1353 [Betaproteobacteria bacterium]|nr:hypothetical protein [Betaproteobacteria bacterium]